ncbi:MAG: hypothetical protein KDC38_11870 [Planctomycetes bacterium]|nr:hypothetical protein [Planctomycetota bacterium]
MPTLWLALSLVAVRVDVDRWIDWRVRAVLPSPTEERWREIPWHDDLLRARREALARGKPLFMWIMNGSPLGCT